MEDSDLKEIRLSDILNLLFNHKMEFILIIIFFTIMGYIYTMNFVNPQYTSSTTLVLVSQPKMKNDTMLQEDSITDSDINLNSKLVSTYTEIITSKSVLRKVIEDLNIDTEEDVIKKKIKVTAVKDSGVLEISVSFDNPKQAAQIANEVAKAFVEKNEELYKIDNVKVLDKAEENEVPTNVNHKRDIFIFIIMGFGVAVAYICLYSKLDTTVKSTDNFEKKYQVPVLAAIPVYNQSTSKKKGDE